MSVTSCWRCSCDIKAEQLQLQLTASVCSSLLTADQPAGAELCGLGFFSQLDMLLESVLRVSWICFLLLSSGACYPFLSKGQTGSGGAGGGTGGGAGSGGSGGSGFFSSSLPFGSAGFTPLINYPQGFSYDINDLRPRFVRLPDPSVWIPDNIPTDPFPLVVRGPTSYIVQSSNGYQRARELLSHSKYSPDDFGPFYSPVNPGDPSQGPGTGTGTKV
ncbi:uncharacterized protein LOC111582279 isoform X2 [Amphiprion ocellaris]|uniref:uncharacterized protein LOC111582279 isoform X2 n=1 Tax=Amphiprion ocellaris TaxID=80972 RepID=UPI002411250C|nr:uncharacterized protein LOC111582279 isoform X2 [Amphiprion ocellaris]